MNDPKEPFRKRMARFYKVPPEFLDGVTDRPFDEVMSRVKNQLDMNEHKKTIQLPNGLAEEGDRVKRIYGEKGVLTNVFRDATRTMISVHIDGDPVPTEIQSFSDWIIDFSPTDALDAVEEVDQEWQKAFYEHQLEWSSGTVDSIQEAIQQIKDRIEQKRKGR